MEEKEKQKKDIGSRISVIRKESGMTMKEFGHLFDPPASDSIVSRWERGISIPNNDRLQKIAAYGNVSMLYLTTGQKAFRDLTDEEIIESFNDLKDFFANHGFEHKKYMNGDLQSEEWGSNEFLYLVNALDFLKYSDSEYVFFLSQLINTLREFDDLKMNESTSKEYLEEYITHEVKNIEGYLRKRFLE
ncbi:helix-turn-helix domain-containing protein [Paraliobacillus zengyii]|uniref:helix-turn-helix domain-containing protein n=1 Tax=Paraliobacillus zengyii TaxID=2213194 RepID=UPI000DD3B1AD|nr:helix-turn-helix transcriptional regulator [Paraliobacillus zengyii]